MTRKIAQDHGLRSLADLKDVAGHFVLRGAPTFETRHQGTVGLREVYDVAFKDYQPIRPPTTPCSPSNWSSGRCSTARLFTTDPAIHTKGPGGAVRPRAPVQRAERQPLVQADLGGPAKAALNAVPARLTTADLLYMDARMTTGRTTVQKMAESWRVQGLA